MVLGQIAPQVEEASDGFIHSQPPVSFATLPSLNVMVSSTIGLMCFVGTPTNKDGSRSKTDAASIEAIESRIFIAARQNRTVASGLENHYATIITITA